MPSRTQSSKYVSSTDKDSLRAAGRDSFAQDDDERHGPPLPLSALLDIFDQLQGMDRAVQYSELVTHAARDDQRELLTYALSLPAERSEPLASLLRVLDDRRERSQPSAPEVSSDEFETLHSAFNATPAQLHPTLLGSLDATRAAAALALCQMPTETAGALWPTLRPILLCDDVAEAKREAEALLEQPEALAPLLIAFRALPLSAHAAVTLELDGATSCLCLLAAGTRRPLNPGMHVLTTAPAFEPRHACAQHGAPSGRCLPSRGDAPADRARMHVLTTARQAAGASSPRGRARRPGTHARAHHGARSSRRRTRGAGPNNDRNAVEDIGGAGGGRMPRGFVTDEPACTPARAHSARAGASRAADRRG